MRWLLGLLLLWTGTAAAAPVELSRYPSIDPGSVTVSGVSSGAFFAHQIHVTYSGLIAGAGLIAGGPYACAEPTDTPWWLALHPYGRTITAIGVCTRVGRESLEPWTSYWGDLPEAPDVERSVEAVNTARAAGTIDDPLNLADDRVWLFSGTADTIVPTTTVDALATFYRRLGVAEPRLAVVEDVPAGHGLPVAAFDGESRFPKRACGDQGLPFVVDCGRDAAEQLFSHLYAADFHDTPGVPARERLLTFDQTAFFDSDDPAASLADTGYLYVPQACADGAAHCRLHVAFHGCAQNAATVDDDFVWDGGYNRWAETNAIVVLYPQTAAWSPAWDPFGWSGNPQGCWDWWGYGGEGYADRRGVQMRAVRSMIARLVAE